MQVGGGAAAAQPALPWLARLHTTTTCTACTLRTAVVYLPTMVVLHPIWLWPIWLWPRQQDASTVDIPGMGPSRYPWQQRGRAGPLVASAHRPTALPGDQQQQQQAAAAAAAQGAGAAAFQGYGPGHHHAGPGGGAVAAGPTAQRIRPLGIEQGVPGRVASAGGAVPAEAQQGQHGQEVLQAQQEHQRLLQALQQRQQQQAYEQQQQGYAPGTQYEHQQHAAMPQQQLAPPREPPSHLYPPTQLQQEQLYTKPQPYAPTAPPAAAYSPQGQAHQATQYPHIASGGMGMASSNGGYGGGPADGPAAYTPRPDAHHPQYPPIGQVVPTLLAQQQQQQMQQGPAGEGPWPSSIPSGYGAAPAPHSSTPLAAHGGVYAPHLQGFPQAQEPTPQPQYLQQQQQQPGFARGSFLGGGPASAGATATPFGEQLMQLGEGASDVAGGGGTPAAADRADLARALIAKAAAKAHAGAASRTPSGVFMPPAGAQASPYGHGLGQPGGPAAAAAAPAAGAVAAAGGALQWAPEPAGSAPTPYGRTSHGQLAPSAAPWYQPAVQAPAAAAAPSAAPTRGPTPPPPPPPPSLGLPPLPSLDSLPSVTSLESYINGVTGPMEVCQRAAEARVAEVVVQLGGALRQLADAEGAAQQRKRDAQKALAELTTGVRAGACLLAIAALSIQTMHSAV